MAAPATKPPATAPAASVPAAPAPAASAPASNKTIHSMKMDPVEWEECLGKMLRHHFNIGEELKALIIQIRKEMKEELVPLAEERATYGKLVKQSIRAMWGLEYEIAEIQKDFATSIGNIDINNLTDDFVEDVMLQSKPLQGILAAIRTRQKAKMMQVKLDYWEKVKDLEVFIVERPPKPVPKPVEVEKKEEEVKKEGDEKVADPASAEPVEPAAAQPAVVEASA
jgi:hypothetical protein